MWMNLKLAWRNLLRNKRRSFIAGTAIGIGLASLIFVDALIIGMEENMVKSATSSFLGEGQIHRAGFRETQDPALTINDYAQLHALLREDPAVAHFTARVLTFGMITSPANVSAISLVGINPATERALSQIDEALNQGAYFEDDLPRDLVLGSKLAEILEVSLGDRVVVTVAQVADSAGGEGGDLSQEMFRVSGIFHFNIAEMDRGMAFIRLEKAQHMLALDGGVHEIAIRFKDATTSRDLQHPFWRKYSQGDNEAVSWMVLLPQMVAAFELSRFSTFLVGLILFGVVALGIINTLFMSLHERMFEFGVLRALGTRPLGIAMLILCEAGALAVLSIVLGGIIAFAATAFTAHTGIDYTGIEFAGVTFRELLYPVLQARQFAVYPFWVFVCTLLVGLYPAFFAARLIPAEVMRRSL